MRFTSKTALITGASSGIGYELAKLFAHDGYRLVLVARNNDSLQRVAYEFTHAYGVPVKVIQKDLSLSRSPGEVFDELERELVCIDVLVNNAGFAAYGLFTQTDLEAALAMMHLNMISRTHLTKLFLKKMLAKGEGKILNVASTAAFQPGPLMAVYYATKAYVLSFSEALAHELRGTGVTMSVLCPGPTRTGFQQRAGMEGSKLFNWGVMDAGRVAAIGYRGLMRSKTVIIPGLKNKLLAFSVRFCPRSLAPHIVRMMQDKRWTLAIRR